MNEGMRCDRISLMHAGKVLACDAPQKLIDGRRRRRTWKRRSSGTWRTRSRRRPAARRHRPRRRPRRPPPRRRRQPAAATAHAKPPHAAAARAAARLRAQRDGADPARSGPPGVRLPRVGAADAGVRVRHHDRRREHPLRRARSRSVAREPRLPRAVRGRRTRYFAGTPPARSRRRGARAPAVRRRLGGHRDPAELRPGLPARQRPRGPRAGRRRDDVPRRHRRAVRPGRARDRRSRIPRPGCRRRPAEGHGRHRGALHVQPDLREHLLDRAERPGAAVAADPRDPDDGQHRAREGARLDDQLLRHADGAARVPGRQAAAVHRDRR